jgi:hypothetical protein
MAVDKNDFTLLPRIQIHDDVTCCFPDDSDLERRIDLVGKELVIPRFDFSICPLTVECKVGGNWCDMEEIGTWEGAYEEK